MTQGLPGLRAAASMLLRGVFLPYMSPLEGWFACI